MVMLLSSTPSDYVDPTYPKLMRKKSDRKMIKLMCEIALNGIASISEIKARFPHSERHALNLLRKAEDLGYVERFDIKKVTYPPGKPTFPGAKHHKRGRPQTAYKLTMMGLYLIRLDPHVRNKWNHVEKNYDYLGDMKEIWNRWANIYVDIRNHDELSKYEKLYSPLKKDFFMLLLNPFIYTYDMETKEVVTHYDTLIEIIRRHVGPEDLKFWRMSLNNRIKWHRKAIEREKILLEKLEC